MMSIMLYVAVAIFTLLQVFDAWSTLLVIRRGGKELNIIMAWLMKKLGVAPALVATKMAILALVVFGVLTLSAIVMLVAICALDLYYGILLYRYNLKAIKK